MTRCREAGVAAATRSARDISGCAVGMGVMVPPGRGAGCVLRTVAVDVCRWSHLGCLLRRPLGAVPRASLGGIGGSSTWSTRAEGAPSVPRSPRSRRTNRSARLALAVSLALIAALGLVSLPQPLPAQAADRTAALVGSLQSELGCPGDWQPSCAQTELAKDPTGTTYSAVFSVPQGSWEFKVAINDSWDESYRADGTKGDVEQPAGARRPDRDPGGLRRHHPQDDHHPDRSRRRPGHGRGPPAGHRQPAQPADQGAVLLRDGRPVRQRLDRQRPRRADRRPAGHRLRPDRQGLLPRWRPEGSDGQARLHQGPGHHLDLADARRSRTAPCRAAAPTSAPATTATGSPTSPRSTRTWAPTPR